MHVQINKKRGPGSCKADGIAFSVCRRRRAAYNAGRMDAIEAAAKSAPEPVANPAQRGYTDGVKTGETAQTPKYKTIRTKKSDWAATDITWYAPHQKSPIAYSTAAGRDLIMAMVDDNPTATVRELQARIKYDQDAKKVLQQYIDAGYGDDVVSDCFGDDAGTGKPAAAAAETQQKGEGSRGAGTKGAQSSGRVSEDREARPESEVRSENSGELEEVRRFHAEAERRGQTVRVYEKDREGSGRRSWLVRLSEVTGSSRSANAVATQEELAKLGIESFVHKGDLEILGPNGKIYSGGDAGVIALSEVGISNSIEIAPKETAGHEAFHYWRGRPGREEYAETVYSGLNWTSRDLIEQYNQINDDYFGGAFDVLDTEAPDYARNMKLFTEEIVAYITGRMHNGEDISGLVNNADEVKAAWDKLVAQNSPKKQPAKIASSSPQQQIADEVRKYIENGKSFSAAKLFEIADQAYGGTMAEGTYTVKDAYDGMELAVNQYLMQSDVVKNGNGDAKAAKATLDKMVELLSKLPTQTKRTEEMEQYQQFSTPPNIAYLAAWSANVTASDVVLEPSAGIGGLALWPKAWGATVYANELSTRRLAFLNQLGLDGTFNLNAEQIDNLLPDSIKPSVVIMNPPFSSAAGRMTKNDTANAKRHIEQALDRLEDGGRLVAILGNGMADDAKGFKTWWNGLRKEYNVRANVQIDGKNYRKYGTTFNVQLAVIDKTGPTTAATKTGTFTDLADIPSFMEEIRNDRTRETGARGVLQDSDVVAGRDGAELGQDIGLDQSVRTARDSSGLRGRGEQGGKTGARDSAGRNGRAGRRGDGGSDVSGSSRRGGNKETVRSSEERTDGRGMGQPDLGARMALSGVAERDLDGKSAGTLTENPDSVYATYVPRKARIEGAKKHPAKLVESAAMAAVEPPDVTYTPSLPSELSTSGKLSDA